MPKFNFTIYWNIIKYNQGAYWPQDCVLHDTRPHRLSELHGIKHQHGVNIVQQDFGKTLLLAKHDL